MGGSQFDNVFLQHEEYTGNAMLATAIRQVANSLSESEKSPLTILISERDTLFILICENK